MVSEEPPTSPTPSTPRTPMSDDLPWDSPGTTGLSGNDGQFERDRVCTDVLMLLTMEQLKEGLP